GILAATAGDYDAAARHFELARSACERLHARPFIALMNIDEARMLAARGRPGDPERALALLTGAREIAGELGMDRIVERAEQARLALGEVESTTVETGVAQEPKPVPPAMAVMRREGDVWVFRFEGHDTHIRDSRGVRCLAVLLANP